MINMIKIANVTLSLTLLSAGIGLSSMASPVHANTFGYIFYCSSAPYGDYDYQWFYWQSPNAYVARNQATIACNNFYGGPVCVTTCR